MPAAGIRRRSSSGDAWDGCALHLLPHSPRCALLPSMRASATLAPNRHRRLAIIAMVTGAALGVPGVRGELCAVRPMLDLGGPPWICFRKLQGLGRSTRPCQAGYTPAGFLKSAASDVEVRKALPISRQDGDPPGWRTATTQGRWSLSTSSRMPTSRSWLPRFQT